MFGLLAGVEYMYSVLYGHSPEHAQPSVLQLAKDDATDKEIT